MYGLVRTSYFDRRLERFLRAHPELRKRIAQLFRDLESDPYRPRLRLHALSGELQGLHAVRLTYAHRITIVIRLAEREIDLINIGSHDEVYRRT